MKLAASLLLSAAICGCSMTQTVPLGDAADAPLKATMTYHLPRTMLEIAFAKNGAVTAETKVVRDPAHAYALRYTQNILSDDTLTLKVDPETGFLTSVSGDATDKTFEVAKEAAKLGTAFLSGGKADKTPFTVLVDPHLELAGVNAALASDGVSVECQGCGAPTPAGPPIDGFYVRPPQTAFLIVRDLKTGAVKQMVEFETYNGSRLVAMPLERRLGVARSTVYSEFQNGVPGAVTHKKPSEALGVVTGVAGVVGAVVAAPVEAAAAQVSQSDAETSAIEAETKRVEAQAKLVEAQAKLKAASGDEDAGDGGGDGGQEVPLSDGKKKKGGKSGTGGQSVTLAR